MKALITFFVLCVPVVATIAAGPTLDLPAANDTSVTIESMLGNYVQAMREPVLLSRMAQPIEEYRFLYVPSFDRSFSVRVTKSGETFAMRAVMLSGKSGAVAGRIIDDRSRALTKADWDKFQGLLAEASFWQRPSPPHPVGGRDGAMWVMEGTGGYRYRMHRVWTPTYKTEERGLGSFIELGKYLAVLSGLQLEKPLD
ncbi:MAG TPA: hypothetical protein VGO11_26765 [Chthoniobacteraceae bacterium]|jgi:hypothetical protein|nr:hypothetical protein [Chthoniobacteraceae bacterium]